MNYTVMRVKEKRIMSALVALFVFPLVGCSGLTRNDLIVDPIETIHGNLIIQFSDRRGFEKGEREVSIYQVALRFEDIPDTSSGKILSLEFRIYSKAEELVFESKRFSGEISRRAKYQDWLLGREEGIELPLSDYEIVVTISHPIDQLDTPEVLVYTKELKAKRLEKSGWLDLF